MVKNKNFYIHNCIGIIGLLLFFSLFFIPIVYHFYGPDDDFNIVSLTHDFRYLLTTFIPLIILWISTSCFLVLYLIYKNKLVFQILYIVFGIGNIICFLLITFITYRVTEIGHILIIVASILSLISIIFETIKLVEFFLSKIKENI